MLRIVYASSATVPLSDADLDALLATSRRNNTASGLTGMLVFRDGDFLQVLEGEEARVREAFHRIEADPRHARVMVLDASEVDAREFDGWSMGFRRLSAGEAPEGFVRFFERRFDPEAVAARGSEALQFLLAFRALA